MRTFHKYNDAGHGWLKVRVKDLDKAGVIGKISGFSYLNGQHAYLEEDCDQWVYLEAIGFDREVDKIVDHFVNYSHIRGYDSFGRWYSYNV